jgi:hypothetical protein
MIEKERYCYTCSHRCHCYAPCCTVSVGVGMSDKDQECGCTKCDCGVRNENKLFSNLIASSEEK